MPVDWQKTSVPTRIFSLITSAFLVLTFVAGCNEKTDHVVRLADATQHWFNAPVFIANEEGDFKNEGLVIRRFEVTSGLAAKNAVRDNNADIGISAAAPLVAAATKGEKIVVLGSYVRSDSILAYIETVNANEQKEGILNCPNGKKIGYVQSTFSEFYLIRYLDSFGAACGNLYRQHQLNLVSLRAPDIVNAMLAGSIDAAVVWEPYILRIQMAMGPRVHVIRKPNLYTASVFLVTSRGYLSGHRQEVQQFVRAVATAGKRISVNSSLYEQKISKEFDLPAEPLSQVWSHCDFTFLTDKGAIMALLTQDARLAQSANIISRPPDLNTLF